MLQFLSGLSPEWAMVLLTLMATACGLFMQALGLNKMLMQMKFKIDAHNDQHIRHTTRLDEHARILGQHSEKIGELKGRAK